MAELLIVREDEILHTHTVTDRPILLGRAPNNDLVLSSGRISWHHAVVWLEGGRVWIKDLNSTNGTFLDGERIRSPQIIREKSELRLGPDVEVRFRDLPADPRMGGQMILEDLSTGLRFPVRSDRILIGTGEDADLRLEEGEERAATLLFYPDGEVWLGTDEVERPLEINEEFTIAGHQLRVVEFTTQRVVTNTTESTSYPYHLIINLQGPTGPQATLINNTSGKQHEVASANRAILLYLLGKKLLEDIAAEVPHDDRGWCSDEDVAVGLWGKSGRDNIDSHLHVLVHRLRKRLSESSFDPWFIEKKRRHIRLRLSSVEIE